MEVIKLDGSMLCYMHRDKDGVHIEMLKNTDDKIKSGTYKKVPLEDCPTECDYRIDISDKTYIALCKCLLSYAERNEFVNIVNNPIDGACWAVAKRKTRGGQNE